MDQHFIVHIPHSSYVIPEEHKKDYLISQERLYRCQLLMSDTYTDELFREENLTEVYVVNPVSRLFCDVERFRDDKDEINAKIGQGLMYTRDMFLRKIRNYDESLRNSILRDYYDPHHAKLTGVVDYALETYGKCTILDGHSFNSVWPPRINCLLDRPDFCIGTDPYHTPDDLRDLLVKTCQENGYHARINTPYCGSITPIKYYGKDKRVVSIMIEVNRKLYMNEKTGEKLDSFEKTQKMCQKLMELISAY